MLGLDDSDEALAARAAEREHHAAAVRKLVEERPWHGRRRRGDRDRVERGAARDTARTVPDDDLDAPVAGLGERAPRDDAVSAD